MSTEPTEVPVPVSVQHTAKEILDFFQDYKAGKITYFELEYAVLIPALMRQSERTTDVFLGHDPIEQENDKIDILQFQHGLLGQLVQYVQQMKEAGENPANEEQKIIHRTFTDWMNTFRMWASW